MLVLFVYEAVYPANHAFFFFKCSDFYNIFINIFKNSEITETNYLYTSRIFECHHSSGPHVDALGASLCRPSVLQGNHPIPLFLTPINVGAFGSTLDSTV